MAVRLRRSETGIWAGGRASSEWRIARRGVEVCRAASLLSIRRSPFAIRPALGRRKERRDPLGKRLRIVPADAVVVDARGRGRGGGPRARRAARASRRSRTPSRATRGARPAARRRRARRQSPRGPRARMRSSGSWPSGRSAKRRLLPGARSGSARSAARSAARMPAASPSKQRIGSSAIRQRICSWRSVSAVPSGATVWAKPAPTIWMTST